MVLEMDINFSRQLIKGKITEVIFEEMFRVSEEFSVLPIGYEYTIPELAQYQHHVHIQKVLENIRNAPDFALISQNKTQVFLVEVKYRHELNQEEILEIAQQLLTKWTPCFLFVASAKGFYFESCHHILTANGDIEPLADTWINIDIQMQYLTLLREFIQ